jgi:hypothetical protein
MLSEQKKLYISKKIPLEVVYVAVLYSVFAPIFRIIATWFLCFESSWLLLLAFLGGELLVGYSIGLCIVSVLFKITGRWVFDRSIGNKNKSLVKSKTIIPLTTQMFHELGTPVFKLSIQSECNNFIDQVRSCESDQTKRACKIGEDEVQMSLHDIRSLQALLVREYDFDRAQNLAEFLGIEPNMDTYKKYYILLVEMFNPKHKIRFFPLVDEETLKQMIGFIQTKKLNLNECCRLLYLLHIFNGKEEILFGLYRDMCKITKEDEEGFLDLSIQQIRF